MVEGRRYVLWDIINESTIAYSEEGSLYKAVSYRVDGDNVIKSTVDIKGGTASIKGCLYTLIDNYLSSRTRKEEIINQTAEAVSLNEIGFKFKPGGDKDGKSISLERC